MLLGHIVRSLTTALLNSLEDLLDIEMHSRGFDPFRKRPKITCSQCGGHINEQDSYTFIGCVLGLTSCMGILFANQKYGCLKNLYRLFAELVRVAPHVGNFSLTAGAIL